MVLPRMGLILPPSGFQSVGVLGVALLGLAVFSFSWRSPLQEAQIVSTCKAPVTDRVARVANGCLLAISEIAGVNNASSEGNCRGSLLLRRTIKFRIKQIGIFK